ncbi:uncharacterized protein K452DRAFT_309541 [Aplosporella prunicola CBS 121167]|uniref:Flavin reductase like domain-containing protein n=1 Tax=Aplosporella prunicola CBS 121167 TaxID=1176127 RepID=A0A6A6BA83_9PEZI|nr:uncharacterized protein K452DRAFT_309541 [Aplosporella prunicola CBS 121167]KAF2141109.1 hypothetical protein K452DRAFT_309541 [Aplosporella prunicola CBS 121167]
MFYEPGKSHHNLPHDPFKACVIPRPIGWISTLSPTGTANLAPYSQFTNLTFDPPYVLFSANRTPSGTQKDTPRNAAATGAFVWNLATWELREAVNATAEGLAYGEDEFARAGLEAEDACVVAAAVECEGGERASRALPMVKRSPVKFECVFHSMLQLPGNPPMGSADVVIGRVVGVHVAEWALTDGRLDVAKTAPIARCGYYQYAVVRETFDMVIPSSGGAEGEDLLAGLEGSVTRHRGIAARDEGGEENGEGEKGEGAERKEA